MARRLERSGADVLEFASHICNEQPSSEPCPSSFPTMEPQTFPILSTKLPAPISQATPAQRACDPRDTLPSPSQISQSPATLFAHYIVGKPIPHTFQAQLSHNASLTLGEAVQTLVDIWKLGCSCAGGSQSHTFCTHPSHSGGSSTPQVRQIFCLEYCSANPITGTLDQAVR
jgi:hypothetical protein